VYTYNNCGNFNPELFLKILFQKLINIMAICVQLDTTYPRGRPAQCPAPLVKETSRARKRRLWRERQEARSAGSATRRPPRCEGWAYLPDIVLEEIFKYLTYKVGAGDLDDV
jgi:hypothetical protein